MAPMAPQTQAPASRGRQIPTYYYAIGAGVAALAFILWRRSQASKAAAAAGGTSGTAQNVVPAGSYGNTGDLSSILPYITALQGSPASGVAAAPTPTTSPSFTQVAGSGDAGNQILDIVGSITAPSTYQGYNVTGGAPVYALVNGTWKLGVPASQLAVGTQLATPASGVANINTGAGQVSERLG